jgi:hypothetical protein
MKALPLSIALLIASLETATAQNNVFERNIEYFQETSSGQPNGCGVEFTLIFTDRSYSGGKVAGIDGSLTNFVNKGNLWTTFKLAGADFPNGPSGQHVSFPIYDASLDVDGTLFRASRFNCETLDNYCGAITASDGLAIFTALEKQGVTLRFNRAKGQLDYSFKLTSEPGAHQDHQEYVDGLNKHSQCMLDILNQAKANSPSNSPQQ